MTAEERRLSASGQRIGHWKRWGPYLSERAWGTVREDYSENGAAWEYLPHDHARSRAYRWNEDGIAGISDRHQIICFALAIWNGRDPILKERLFGLTGNRGIMAKMSRNITTTWTITPTHSYMKYLYKYPQAEFPYDRSLKRISPRTGHREVELVDTGIFDDSRYFDVFVEYAKADVEDILVRITVANRGPEGVDIARASDGLVSQYLVLEACTSKTHAKTLSQCSICHRIRGAELMASVGWLFEGSPELLFTENETNYQATLRHTERPALFEGRDQQLHRQRPQ